MFEATLSVDLGASYTKVAFRSACLAAPGKPYKEEATLLMVGASPLIPSLAVRTKRPAQPWIFGREAANIKPGKDMEVFANWKANLFRPENDKHSAAAVIVAYHFFGWLRRQVETAGIDLKAAQTRVAMPAFKTFNERAVLIARCMELNGWESPLILKAPEPHANAVGLFSKGRNIVGGNTADGLLPNYGQMFGSQNELVQAARGFTFGTHNNLFSVMILDIGAFTTDIAIATFDVSGADDVLGDGLGAIRQESHVLGVIDELDRPLFAELGTARGFDWSELSFQDGEFLKGALYNGKSYTLLPKPGLQIQLGGVGDEAIVAKHVASFVDGVWGKVLKFIEKRSPSVVYLTGGGILIPRVAADLRSRFALKGIGVGVVDDGVKLSAEESILANSNGLRPWKTTGEGLPRLATALGGASVVLDASAAPYHGEPSGLAERPPLTVYADDDLVTCRCQGGNRDCCFCGGRGFYPRA